MPDDFASPDAPRMPEGGSYCKMCKETAGPNEVLVHVVGCAGVRLAPPLTEAIHQESRNAVAGDLMARFDKMNEAADAKQDEGLPPLAREREVEAIAKAEAVFAAARELMATGMLTAVGYRILVKPIEAIKTLEAAEAEAAPHLHEQGFEVKTAEQQERESRGENHGIVMSLGPIAFERLGGRAAWVDEGDTAVFSRYAGTRVEHPPGSGVFYQLINDEDVFGKIT